MSTRERLDERRTIAAHLAVIIRENIITEVYAPGQALREAELAKRFQVSRIPLREALRQLEAEQFVTIKPYRGAIVTPLSARDGVEIAEMRSVLLQLAARHALPRLADTDLQRLHDLLAEMEVEPDGHRWGVLISEFHALLFTVPERPRLMGLLNSLQMQSRRYRVYLYRNERLRRLAERCLREMADACRDRDPETVARHVKGYFDTMIDGFHAETRAQPRADAPQSDGDAVNQPGLFMNNPG